MNTEELKGSKEPATLGSIAAFYKTVLAPLFKAQGRATQAAADEAKALRTEMASMERRLSRHATHLAQLETRTKKLEHQ